MLKITLIAVLAAVAVIGAAAAANGGNCGNMAMNACVWQNTCPTCNRLSFDTVQLSTLVAPVTNPNGWYVPGARMVITGSGRSHFPAGEKLTAGGWAVDLYETGRLEPEVYNVDGDAYQSLVFNADGTFDLKITDPLLNMVEADATGIFLMTVHVQDQDHVDDFYVQLQYNLTHTGMMPRRA